MLLGLLNESGSAPPAVTGASAQGLSHGGREKAVLWIDTLSLGRPGTRAMAASDAAERTLTHMSAALQY